MGKTLALFFVVVIGGGVPACSDMPRIRVLHDPLTPVEHVTLGMAYESEGRFELAVREYKEALRQQSEYVPALLGLGNLTFNRGAFKEAEAYYRQALETAPDDAGANNNLATLYLTQQEKLDEAERLASRALVQAGPLQPYVLDTLAHIYMRQGRYQEARATAKEAELLAPSHDETLQKRLVQLRQELETVHLRSK